MADNVDLTALAGTCRTDDVGGVQYQVVKLDQGADGLSSPVTSIATETTLALIKAKTDNLDVLLSTRTKPSDAQHVIVDSGTALTDTQLRATPVPVSGTVAVTGVATEATLDARTGSLTETAPTTDTASSGLNGRLQRIAQRISSLITALGSPFQAGGSIGNTSFGTTNLPTTVDTNSGNKSASTLRVVLATDQPALTNKLLVTPDSVALPANQSVNVSQINGVTPLMGAGNTGTGSPRVTIATDQAAVAVKRNTDTGRTYIALYAKDITGVTSEGMATFVKNVAGTETTGQTAYTITSGKTFRVQSISLIIKNSTTVANNLRVWLRAGGTVGTSSPIVTQVSAAAAAAVATVIGYNQITFPDGIDIAGDGTVQLGISHLENVTTAAITSITVNGFEY